MELRPGSEALIELLTEDGIAPEQVKLILNSHGHQDHVDAGLWWRDCYGARIAVHEADTRFCGNAPTWKQRAAIEGRIPSVDISLEEGELLLGDGRVALRLVHSPGHSPGSISIYHPSAKALFTGDVVFYHTVGASHFHHGNPADLRRSIERLSELDVEHLLPGHVFHHVEFISGREQVEDNFRYVQQNRL
jgi:glyoxylase-like metal-dependent hydrolase (beta-lactamase superfamily II)